MKLTKTQIKSLEKALKKAQDLENKSQIAAQNIASLIQDYIGIEGAVDHLQGDGFGFTPASDDRTHISIELLIESAKSGIDITKDFILDNLSL